MAVDVLYDANEDRACLCSTSTEWAFGPVFRGPDAQGDAEAFLNWFRGGMAALVARELGIHANRFGSANDPRHYSETDLEKLWNVWKAAREAARDIDVTPEQLARGGEF